LLKIDRRTWRWWHVLIVTSGQQSGTAHHMPCSWRRRLHAC
jgi:hypothetical protein